MIRFLKIFVVIAIMCLCAWVFCTYYDTTPQPDAATEAYSVTVEKYHDTSMIMSYVENKTNCVQVCGPCAVVYDD